MPQTVLLTGATSGLGLACAKYMARFAAKNSGLCLILPCRDVHKGNEVAQALRALAPHVPVHIVKMDMCSLASVREAAAAILALEVPPIDVLLLNAGIQFANAGNRTDDGIEMTFAVNHLANFLLANLLVGHLADPARIIFTASGTHDPAQNTSMPEPHFLNAEMAAFPDHDKMLPLESTLKAGQRRYTTSKLCNVLCAYEMARRVEQAREGGVGGDVHVAAFDPGMMPGTGLARDYGALLRFAWKLILPLLVPFGRRMNSPAKSGEALAKLALDPAIEIQNRYFVGLKPEKSSDKSYDRRAQADLWAVSERLCFLSVRESPLCGPQWRGIYQS